nr:uncharacterized protein LOC106683890 [Halyomorpha halys]
MSEDLLDNEDAKPLKAVVVCRVKRSQPQAAVNQALATANPPPQLILLVPCPVPSAFFIFPLSLRIMSQVGNVITNRNANRLEFERLLDGAKTYMRHHKVPGGMKRRILRWYDYSWSRGRIQGGGDINTALGLLPDKLKTELALHVNLSVLKKVTIFQKCQPEFLHDLVLKMKAYIFTPGDLICRKGEVAREMFIIADGILEVMSETGRVLTTMQAGDFFGEIGILNLDGLNKRTADVRSVGYSELFSLSREDVLAAMKDYPEAQVILQNFGRQRLTEARNLNRAWKLSGNILYSKSFFQKKEKGMTATVRVESETDASKRSIVEKITGDVKELKNVFRKSTRTKSDCMELEPTKSQDKESKESIGKAVLCRVPCIHNEDTSQDEESPAPQKIGAGLPLFQRLKLLKEKQEQEQLKNESKDSASSFAPEEEKKSKDSDSVGVPLLQRILLMKQKDEKKAGVVQTTANMAAEVLASTVRTQITSPTQLTLKSNLKYDGVDDSKLEKKLLTEANRKKGFNRFKEKLMEEGERSGTHFPSSYLPAPTADTTSEKKNHYESDNESWILIKKAVLVPNNSMDLHEKRLTDIRLKNTEKSESDHVSLTSKQPENALKYMIDEESKLDEAIGGIMEETDIVGTVVKSSPTSPYHSTASKTYESIDDLSPEYSGLPFVKKLKILNERQKLAELEKEKPSRQVKNVDGYSSRPSRPPPIDCSYGLHQSYESPLMSPESNETLERRKLKSILKKLSSASTAQSGESSSSEISNIIRKKSSSEMRKLLRAQTVEGYAARHSKFTKSVTFNHETVDLETSSTESVSAQIGTTLLVDNNVESSDINRDNQTCSNVKNVSLQTDTNQNEDVTEAVLNIVTSSDSVNSVFKAVQKWEAIQESTTSEGQSEKEKGGAAYVNIQREIITTIFEEIRKAIDEHLGNIESKYVDQYIRLQLEVKRRDDLIMELQRRLSELENIPVSMVLSEDEDDEEEVSYYEHQSAGTPSVSYRDLSKSLSQSQSHSQSESTIIRIESDDSTDEEEVFFSNHTDWEIHLLAEELARRERTRRRAISFDVSQLQPRPTIDELSEHEETESSFYAVESPPRPEERINLEETEYRHCPTVYMTRRSLSANSIQTQVSRRIIRQKHYSLNGTEFEESTLTRRPLQALSSKTMK